MKKYNRSLPKAVVLAAGLGQRLHPLTRAIPKQMLPLGRKPVIHHVVDELKSAGLKDIAVVLGPDDVVTPKYISYMFPDIISFVQRKPTGTVDAVLAARDWFYDESEVMVAMGDAILEWDTPPHPLIRLWTEFRRQQSDSAVLVRMLNFPFGRNCVGTTPHYEEPSFLIDPIIKNHSRMGVGLASRWILAVDTLKRCESIQPKANGERLLKGLIRLNPRVLGVRLNKNERHYDIGTWEQFLMGSAEAALHDTQFGAKITNAVLGGSSHRTNAPHNNI